MSIAIPRGDEAVSPFLVSSERLTGYVKLLEGETVELKAAERWATLICGRSKTKLPLDHAANYPALDFEMKDAWLRCEQAVLGRMIRATGFAISDEESKYTLNGALLEVSENRLRMVSTDGHRMAMYTVTGEFDDPKRALLPAALLKALYKTLCVEKDASVILGESENDIKARIPGDKLVAITHRKMAGQFPNYEAVIPKGEAAVIAVSSAELLASVGRCVAMSDRKTCAIKMTFAPGGIHLKAVDPQAGETDETIGCTPAADFPEFTSGFNGDYLAEALKHIKGDATLVFAKTDGQTAMMIKAEPVEGETFEYVVMPMRV
jgi:DNA polymerase-3 subunit beta